MGVDQIKRREEELVKRTFARLTEIPGLHILAGERKQRIGVFSFFVEGVHHNLIVKLLNDRYGIQVRGGCSCAGTYGHYLLNMDWETSHSITEKINRGDLSVKPGWVRLSLHPTMSDDELEFILRALNEVVNNASVWGKDYIYDRSTGEFTHRQQKTSQVLDEWFAL
jgi:selenocysteine lyase/cysteine desulfurase